MPTKSGGTTGSVLIAGSCGSGVADPLSADEFVDVTESLPPHALLSAAATNTSKPNRVVEKRVLPPPCKFRCQHHNLLRC